ncbi:MAG: hypothetical protein AAF236_03600 [Verrucomicrobiota bacterium]
MDLLNLSWLVGLMLPLGGGLEMGHADQTASEALLFGEAVVPAAQGVRTDQAGYSWSIEADGSIGRMGNGQLNSGAVLSIDGLDFSPSDRWMSRDGKTVFVRGSAASTSGSGTLEGLAITRIVSVLPGAAGGLRYAEVLQNQTPNKVRLRLTLRSNFAGNYQTFFSDRGLTEPIQLEEGERGILVLPGQGATANAFSFGLAGSRSQLLPSISAENRYALAFHYGLTLEPGSTEVLLHTVAQISRPDQFSESALLSATRPWRLELLVDGLPGSLPRRFLNFSSEELASEQPLRPYDFSNRLGVPTDARDVLAIGDQTRLFGKASGTELSIEHHFGEATFPFDRVRALVGSETDQQAQVYFADGQRLSGLLSSPDLGFRQASGEIVSIDLGKLDRLVMGRSGDRIQRFGLNTEEVMIELFSGDRLRVANASSLTLKGRTPWGEIEVAATDLAAITPTEGGLGGWWHLTDGSRLRVWAGEETVTVTTNLLGAIDFPMREIRSLVSSQGDRDTLPVPQQGVETVLYLGGGQRAVSVVGNSRLPLRVGGQTLPLELASIREMRAVSKPDSLGPSRSQSARFLIKKWDGGSLDAAVTLDLLSVEVAGRTWKIPLGDIRLVEAGSPELSPELLDEVELLIPRLGDSDWETREAATIELGSYGPLIRGVLRRQLAEVDDPEISRRLERLLADLEAAP